MRSRQVLFRTGALLIVLLIAAAMFIIGRGHTVYFDNKTAEYNGQTYEAFHKVVVTVDGEQVAKLGKRERGMADTMGQKFQMTLEITDEKGAQPHSHKVSMPIPYGMDGVIINILHIMSVHRECRKSALRECRHYSRKIYRARSFRSVKAPYGLYGIA